MLANSDDLLFRTVRMRSEHADRFQEAFAWLMERSGELEGCHGVAAYRAADGSDDVLIVELWESTDAMARSYERLGNVPFEFVERAGNPEMLEDRLWNNATVTSAQQS